MKPAALATETIDVAAFLAISRKHLGLSSTTPGGANARMALNPFKRHAPGSRAKPNSRVERNEALWQSGPIPPSRDRTGRGRSRSGVC